MSKSNDTSELVTLDHHNTLADNELDAVTGGLVVLQLPKDTRDYQMIRYGQVAAAAAAGK